MRRQTKSGRLAVPNPPVLSRENIERHVSMTGYNHDARCNAPYSTLGSGAELHPNNIPIAALCNLQAPQVHARAIPVLYGSLAKPLAWQSLTNNEFYKIEFPHVILAS